MTVAVSVDQILKLAPSIRSSYREAFQNAQPILDSCGISASPLRVAHFMAQMLHESSGFTTQFENLNYSAERLPVVWPSRFQPKGPLDPAQCAHDPEALGNLVYGGRMGNDADGDGYRYRGRGLLQLTGKESYAAATQCLRKDHPECPDFVADPDAVIGAQWSVAVAAAEWEAKGCNECADKDDVKAITRAINGGLIGLAERTEWLKRCKAVWN
jgi:putative chitinase